MEQFLDFGLILHTVASTAFACTMFIWPYLCQTARKISIYIVGTKYMSSLFTLFNAVNNKSQVLKIKSRVIFLFEKIKDRSSVFSL